MELSGRILVEGEGRGQLLRLSAPLGFWGGVDPTSGLIINAHHPQCGASVKGMVLLIDQAIGSCSSSAVMLELISRGLAPAAIVMREADAILALGAIVARELGLVPPPMIEAEARALPHRSSLRVVARDGRILAQ